MPVSASTVIYEIRSTGSDTICGGGFDPTQTAGMWTDGAGTTGTSSTCTFTSSSKAFAASEVGAYLFIASGTNWKKGWYLITAATGGALTVSAAAGGYQPYGDSVNTSAGFASVASPTNATWTIDYSQQAAAAFTGTDGTAAGSGSTLSSATIVFEGHMVGNVVRITAGTNATAGHHVITSVAAGVATFNNAVTTGATSNTTIYVGGALLSLGYCGAIQIAGTSVWVKYSATPYAATSTSSNASVGRYVSPTGSASAINRLQGYDAVRGDETGNRPEFKWDVNAGFGAGLLALGANTIARNFTINGNKANRTGTRGIDLGAAGTCLVNVKVFDCAGGGIMSAANVDIINCEQTGCVAATNTGSGSARWWYCYIHDNTLNITVSTGTQMFYGCIFDTNGAANISSTGASYVIATNCIFYGTTGSGVDFTAAPNTAIFQNCVFESNSTYGVSASGTYPQVRFLNCAFYNNTTGKYQNMSSFQSTGEIAASATVFTDAANGNFKLNNAAGGALKSGGYPSTFPGVTWASNVPIGAAPASSSGTRGPFQPL